MGEASHSGDVAKTVFVVDDHAVVRIGLADLLEEEPDLRVIGQAGTAREALARVPALRPDVVVLDVRLPDGNGVELCRELRSRLPGTACLMLTSFPDEQAVVDALLAGAAGYVIKDVRGMELASAVRAVAAGGRLLDDRTTAELLDRLRTTSGGPALAALTRRERVLLEHIRRGLTNREIGERMFLAEKTVKNQVSRLLAKLGVQRRTQAAVLATRARRPEAGRG